MSVLSTFDTATEVRPLSKAPNLQLLPGCVFTIVSVHLDGLHAENKFRYN